ncbi:GNAT family N-acetyltransferase [Campylobacter lanienae]|uniref:GNAT family N-acetyltransferase n=2 Tax=Campylobacter lanienae TaxID=75658 RepID=UPI000BB4382E|nr:GNAT family N-acetyltransferase [Campylobacter lanienae]
MEIIEAYWEKRNLGVDTYEIRLNNNDLNNILDIIEEIFSDKYKNAYLIIKMPVSNLRALHALEDNGFRFMETQFHMKKSLINYETPKIVSKIISRLKNVLKQKEISKDAESWRAVVDLMTDNMFYTDRIYLDPELEKGTSCNRYQNWIMDEVNNINSHLFVYYYKDAPIGFGFVKIDQEKKVIYDLLEGIFEKYQNAGFGYMMFDCALKSYKNQGLDKLETSISSNNPSILKLDQIFGYTIVKEEYVLRKFNKGD